MFSNIKTNIQSNHLHSNSAKKNSESTDSTLKLVLLNKTDKDGNNHESNQNKKKNNNSSAIEHNLKDDDISLDCDSHKNEQPKKDFLKLLNII